MFEINERRGRFAVSRELLFERDFRREFMPRVVVLAAWPGTAAGYTVFEALSEDFEIVPVECETPEYRWEIARSDDARSFKAVRLRDGCLRWPRPANAVRDIR